VTEKEKGQMNAHIEQRRKGSMMQATVTHLNCSREFSYSAMLCFLSFSLFFCYSSKS
jgi:hypothetical protein